MGKVGSLRVRHSRLLRQDVYRTTEDLWQPEGVDLEGLPKTSFGVKDYEIRYAYGYWRFALTTSRSLGRGDFQSLLAFSSGYKVGINDSYPTSTTMRPSLNRTESELLQLTGYSNLRN